EAFRAMWGVDVHLVELRSQVMSGILDPELSRLVESELIEQGVNLKLGCNCREIRKVENGLELIIGSGETITVDRVIAVTGVIPNTRLADGIGLNLGVTGGIVVNDRLQTSDPEIYAAGDCVELSSAVDGKPGFWALGSLANRMGRIAGDNICNGDSRFGRVAGVTIVKFFELSIASVGLNSDSCRENGYDTSSCWGTFHDSLWYFPESGKTHLKLIYDKKNGQILGVQAVGSGEMLYLADKAAQIIQAGWTIDKLPDLEQAYSPPYSQPFDPFHTMAFIEDNSRSAGVELISPNDFYDLPDDAVILDVRKPEEIEAVVVQKGNHRYVEIPIEELRARINEVPKKCFAAIICEMGSRSWDAALILRRAGWSDVGILAGGALFLPKNTIQSKVD
ncbi:MAG: FAD-dependent oxidoreductase, partial [Calditrichaeota bacterium]|nr:FAD-dependent oxidoreductase [Calditrichota bacterium]